MTAYGSPVTIVVSQGPETFPVPNSHGPHPGGGRGQGDTTTGSTCRFFDVPGTPRTRW